jgi:hypothetical protein
MIDEVTADPRLSIPPQWFAWALDVGGDVFNIERARRMAVKLMGVYVPDWTLRIGNGKELAGSATSHVDPDTWLFNRPGVLMLSAPLMSLWDETQREQIIRHEIAHALSGPRHDDAWVLACARVGARPEHCWGENGETRIPGQWHGTCPGGHKHKPRQRKPRKNYSCGGCNPGVYDERFLITWTKEGA